MIILIGGEKGGPGKTTLATNLAAMRQAITKDVLLIDTDKQQTASFWCATREENDKLRRVSSIQKYSKSLRYEIVSLAAKYQDVIIDAGGRDSIEVRCSLLVAHKVIFPLRISQFDLWTLGRLSSLVERTLPINPNLKSYVVLNQVPNDDSPSTEKEISDARAFINETPILKLLDVVIHEKAVFRKAALEGKGVVECKPKDLKASEEIEEFYLSVFNNEF